MRNGYGSWKRSAPLATRLNSVGETKLNALVRNNELTPTSQIQGGTSPVYYQNYVLGENPNNYVNFNTLGGMVWPQGTGDNERIGKYLYLKKTTLHLKIGLTAGARQTGPTRFRVIVYKSKRVAAPGQGLVNPSTNLFLDDRGREFGVDSSIPATEVSYQFQTALPNKKMYHIIKDKKFLLCPDVSAVSGGSNLVTPSSQSMLNERNMTFSLGHWKKTTFIVDNQPSDLNYTYCVTIISMPVGSQTSITNNWRSSTRGTVSAQDS